MSRVLGHGRYARETYPDRPGGGSGVVVGGAVQEIRFPIGTAAAQDSGTPIPNGAIIGERYVDIKTPYSPGTTIQVGVAGSPDLLLSTTDIVATSAHNYGAPADDTVWPGPADVLVTVGGAPAAGAGFVVVQYVQAPQP